MWIATIHHGGTTSRLWQPKVEQSHCSRPHLQLHLLDLSPSHQFIINFIYIYDVKFIPSSISSLFRFVLVSILPYNTWWHSQRQWRCLLSRSVKKNSNENKNGNECFRIIWEKWSKDSLTHLLRGDIKVLHSEIDFLVNVHARYDEEDPRTAST